MTTVATPQSETQPLRASIPPAEFCPRARLVIASESGATALIQMLESPPPPPTDALRELMRRR